MLVHRINILMVPIANLDAALEPFQRLGLAMSPVITHPAMGTQASLLIVGDEDNYAQVEFLRVLNRDEALAARGVAFVKAAEQRSGALALYLGTEDFNGAVSVLRARGLQYDVHPAPRIGPQFGTLAELWEPPEGAIPVALGEVFTSRRERLARWQEQGLIPCGLYLKRLDHVAAIAQDLEASTHFWTDVLEVPVFGEVRTPTTIIRQFKLGDAMVELLGPASSASPIAQRRPGLLSMAAYEVTDMGAAVAQARAAGFTVADPAPGSLPGTRVTSIPGTELSGFTLQLLEYV